MLSAAPAHHRCLSMPSLGFHWPFLDLPFLDMPLLCRCPSLIFHCLSLPFTASPATFTLTFHRLSLISHCLFTACR